MTITTGARCPGCDSQLVSLRGAADWCAECEWNLDVYDSAGRRPELGWSWVAGGRISWPHV